MMASFDVIRYAQPAELAIATFAIEKGTQLFFSRFNDLLPGEENANEQIINIVFVESSNNKETKTKKIVLADGWFWRIVYTKTYLK